MALSKRTVFNTQNIDPLGLIRPALAASVKLKLYACREIIELSLTSQHGCEASGEAIGLENNTSSFSKACATILSGALTAI